MGYVDSGSISNYFVASNLGFLTDLIGFDLVSLIHVPINIPAFALSTNTEADMNNELMAHGFSNIAAGLFGGLQNYMAYTQSVLYDRSGGTGRPSGIAVALTTSVLFFVGPTIGKQEQWLKTHGWVGFSVWLTNRILLSIAASS
jgi:MFS superfamily sulfate permease-like transporter